MVPLPSSLKRRLPSLATVIPLAASNVPIGRDKAGNEIFVIAARSHVVPVVEARRRSAFARDDQFGAVAIVLERMGAAIRTAGFWNFAGSSVYREGKHPELLEPERDAAA